MTFKGIESFLTNTEVQKAVIDQNMTGEIKIDDADFFWDPIVCYL